MVNHNDDLGIPAEWHFFATSHGKGLCDRLGGTVKRLAAKASLQKTQNDLIQTPQQWYDWAAANLSFIKYVFIQDSEINEHREVLQQRFDNCIPVVGTQKLHCFLLVAGSTAKLNVKAFSASLTSSMVCMNSLNTDSIPWNTISNYVTCGYEMQWWLAYVVQKDVKSKEIT